MGEGQQVEAAGKKNDAGQESPGNRLQDAALPLELRTDEQRGHGEQRECMPHLITACGIEPAERIGIQNRSQAMSGKGAMAIAINPFTAAATSQGPIAAFVLPRLGERAV
jgi:hypothetical protein